MSRPLSSTLLESALALAALMAAIGLPTVAARQPANTARLPQEFEVHAPFPRRGLGPPRIPVYKNRDANRWVSTLFTRIASAASLAVVPGGLIDEEQRERDQRQEAGLPEGDGKGGTRRRKGSSITILEWDIVNAFATPGEKLYVTTSLLEFVESDDELAGVIGHEIAHVRLNHIEKRMKRQMVSSMLFALATIREGGDAFMAGQALSTLPVLPYGQDQELEADRVGMTYMIDAGYDPNGVTRFMEKLAATDKEERKQSGLGSLFNTHPPTPKRIQLISSRLDQLAVPRQVPRRLSYDFKYERLGIDLSNLDLQSMIRKPGRRPVPEDPGKIFTSMRISGNLVDDGGFDTAEAGPRPPAGWKVVAGAASIERDPLGERGQCLRLMPSHASGVAEVEGPLTRIDAEQDYVLAGQARAGDPHERLSIGLRYYDEKKTPIRTEFPAAWQVFVPDSWTKYQGVVFSSGNNFSLPSTARHVRVVLSGTFTRSAPGWFDDLALVRVGK